jgi:predicted transposase/invertase (TIGR01784 family)
METDSLFYRLFEEKPKLLFELLGEKPPRTTYSFGAHELKQTSLRTDGVLKPRSPKHPIFFMEAQGYHDSRKDFYASFFTKIFLYLRQYSPPNDWRAVVLFTQKSFDPGVHPHYREFFESRRLQPIYLDKLPPEAGDLSPEMGVLQLMGMKDKQAIDRGRIILARNDQTVADVTEQKRILELIVTVFVHKFSKLSREEIISMLGITRELRNSRFFQEFKEEGRQEEREELLSNVVPMLLQSGMSVEAIASSLKVSVAQVQRAIPS